MRNDDVCRAGAFLRMDPFSRRSLEIEKPVDGKVGAVLSTLAVGEPDVVDGVANPAPRIRVFASRS